MSDPNRIPQLISRLLRLTEERKVDWTETVSDNDFQATVGQFVVTISRFRDPNNWDAWDYQIRIADRKGADIDEATDSSLDRQTLIEGNSPQKAFSLLYDGARRSARKVDEALTSLLSSLESLE